MNLLMPQVQDASERSDRLEQPTRHDVDRLAMPPQGRNGLSRSAHHFLYITLREPSKRDAVWSHQVETVGINRFERNDTVHRCLGKGGNLNPSARAAPQFIYALNAGKGAVAVETHRIKALASLHHSVN
jgi:hypothetical protein